KYRPANVRSETDPNDDESDESVEEESDDGDEPTRGKKTKVEWIEAIPPGRFYLRVGLGRKASGSYYTPHSFVRFLVQETLGPQVEERSPQNDPQPLKILELNVLDPAMARATSWSRRAGSWLTSSTKPAACATTKPSPPSGGPSW